MTIQDIPPELVEQIVDNIAPDTHLSFVLSCKRHHECSQSILAHHRACSVEHKEITDVFEDFSRPEDPVAAWHNRAFVAYHAFTIVDALQIPTLRSLKIRTFQGLYRRDNFDPSQLPNNFKSAVTELYLNHMKRLDKTRLEGLVQSFKTLKVLKVDNCSINTGHQLMESIAKHHSQTIEVIHFGEKQKLCGSPGTRIYDIQLLSNFAKLRHLVVDLADLYNYAARWNENLQKILYLVLKLPSLEYLKIITTGSIRRNNTPSMPGGVEQGALDKALAWALRRMVNKPHRPQKVNLRTHEVYPSFDRAVMAGNEVGIVVETYGDINDDE